MDLRKLPPIDVMGMLEPTLNLVKGTNITFDKGLKKPYLLPTIAPLLAEDPFYSLGMCWSDDGIKLFLRVDSKFEGVFFPEVEKGDGIEVFIDTRSVTNASSIHKYCHHFIFYPKEVEGISGIEVTRFKSDDRHDPASSENFSIDSTVKAKVIEMEITIPEMSLFGYNPAEVPKMGFACRVHRSSGDVGHFPLSGLDYKIETCPALWARFKLVK